MTDLAITLGVVAIVIYIGSLVYITFFCLMQLHLLWKYFRKRRMTWQEEDSLQETVGSPFVTVQLPIYNERYVVERLIRRVAAFHYPRDRFEIQVLDDSDDDTIQIIEKVVAELRKENIQIHHVRREDRKGFKAGALQAGLRTARGQYVAIFDADFLPHPNFLMETIPYFDDDSVGVVQTRWEHINEKYSILTQLQAFQLNVHFTVEQTGRESADYMLQFNGTGGVWRKATIADAGGWQADTLTEDLDLSYRAQMKGWKIKYLPRVGSPAELPAEMNGLKSQQFRWMKGGAETAKKLLPTVWSSGLSLDKKLHATGHLLSSAIFIFVFIAGVFSVPTLIVVDLLNWDPTYFTVFLTGLLSIGAVYFVADHDTPGNIAGKGRRILRFMILFPVFLALSMGLSLHNSLAVLQGFRGKKSPFIRTPKFNLISIQDTFSKKEYFSKKLSKSTIGEGFLTLYFLFGIVYGFYCSNHSFVFYHLLLCLGFGTICYFSVKHASMS